MYLYRNRLGFLAGSILSAGVLATAVWFYHSRRQRPKSPNKKNLNIGGSLNDASKSNAQNRGASTEQLAAPMRQSPATTNQSTAPNLQLSALNDTMPTMQHPLTSNIQHGPPTRQFAAPTTVGQWQSAARNIHPPAPNVVASAMSPPTHGGRVSLRKSKGTNLPATSNPRPQPTNLQPVPPPGPANLPVPASDQPVNLLAKTSSQEISAVWSIDNYHSLRLEALENDEIADMRNFNQDVLYAIFNSNNPHIAIDASITSNPLAVAWTSKNLYIFIAEWVRFVKADTGSSSFRTRTLTVNLPTTPIMKNRHDGPALENSIGNLDLLPMDLEVLSWTGHPKQLQLFLSHTTPFKQLRRLTLRCRISLHDFKFILSRGQETLREVDICTLIGSETSSQAAVAEGAEPCTMKSLEFLALESEAPFRLLCDTINCFTFPTLRDMDIMSEGDFTRSFFTDFTGDNLRKFKIHCAMSEEDHKWLRDHKDSLRLDKFTIDASTPKRRVL